MNIKKYEEYHFIKVFERVNLFDLISFKNLENMTRKFLLYIKHTNEISHQLILLVPFLLIQLTHSLPLEGNDDN